MPLLTVTPNNCKTSAPTDDPVSTMTGLLQAFQWFTGIRVYNFFAGIYIQVGPGRFVRKFGPQYVEETLETLHEKDRLLLVQGFDFTGNSAFPSPAFKQSYAEAVIEVPSQDAEKFRARGKQLQVTFDIEALRPIEVQKFVGFSYVETLPVNGRAKVGFLIDMPGAPWNRLSFALRPTKNEMYLYSAEALLL